MKKYSVISAMLALLVITLSACHARPIKSEKGELDVVFSIDGEKVYYEEIRYLAMNYMRSMEQSYGMGIWENEDSSEFYRKALEEKVFASAERNAAIMAFCEAHGVDINGDDITDSVAERIDAMIKEAGGKEEYKKQLADNYLTDHCLRYLIKVEACERALLKELYKDGSIDASDEAARAVIDSDELIRTLHVYIRNDEGDDIEENRKKAQKVLDELTGGADIKKMIGRYSEDIYMTTTDGYYFMKGEYTLAYEEAAFALDINEYSGVVETEDGFYVIQRLEKSNDYVNTNFESLKDRYLYLCYEKLLNDRIETAEKEFTEYGNSLDITKIK